MSANNLSRPYACFRILDALKSKSLSIRELSRKTGQWTQSIAEECKSLEERGFIKSDQKRPKRFSLTLKGKVTVKLHENTTFSFTPVQYMINCPLYQSATIRNILLKSRNLIKHEKCVKTDADFEMVVRGWGSWRYYPLLRKSFSSIGDRVKTSSTLILKHYQHYGGSYNAIRRVLDCSEACFAFTSPVALEQFDMIDPHSTISRDLMVVGEVSPDTLQVFCWKDKKPTEIFCVKGSLDTEKRLQENGYTCRYERDFLTLSERFLSKEFCAVAVREPFATLIKEWSGLKPLYNFFTPHPIIMKKEHGSEAYLVQKALANSLSDSINQKIVAKLTLNYINKIEREIARLFRMKVEEN